MSTGAFGRIEQARQRHQRVVGLLLPRLTVWAGTLAAAGLLLVGSERAAAVLAVLTVAFLAWWRLTRVSADADPVSRTVLAVLLAIAAARTGLPWLWLVVAVTLVGLLMAEQVMRTESRGSLRAWNLPGLPRPRLADLPEPLFCGSCAALLALASGLLGLPPAAAGGLALAALLLGLALSGRLLVRERRKQPHREIRAALDAFGPRYALYYNGTTQGAYQLKMWLPYLERAGERSVLIVRDPRFSAKDAGIDLPVILVRSTESLEHLIVPSLRAFFYVNNHASNADGVRFADLTHVHLGHGDSEKPASYNATTAMFDRIFVAGQAGVDRFARHGVLIPEEKFVLAGRPQIEDLEVRPVEATLPAEPVILYAPTWRGSIGDSLFGSLGSGERIVRGLLAAGATVWFRPHPYDYRDATSRVRINQIDAVLAGDRSRPHRTSEQTREHSVLACLNASDALVTDISSVASDYLCTGKPFALVDTGVVENVEFYYPLVRAAHLLSTTGDLEAELAAFLREDATQEARAEITRYYLGDAPPSKSADVFVAAVRAAIADDDS